MKTGILVRLVAILVVIITGGFMYGFAGREIEWGTFQVMGAVIVAAMLPWEWFLLRIIYRNKKK